ncbi:MAG: fatty acid desaturase [Proteobacteria bacterium]|nr:fatty acid desaturase [Pseudomonadota bacterium]
MGTRPLIEDSKKFSILTLSKAQRQALLARSDGRGALQLAGHVGLVLSLGGLIQARIPYWPLLLLPQGILVMFLFCAMHESIHRTAFRTKWCNDGVAAVCGWLVALPPIWFRHFHIYHHRFTNDPARDPELAAAKPASRAAYLWHLTGLPTWGSRIRVLIGSALGRNRDSFVPDKARAAVAAEARGFLALYAVALAGSLAFASDILLWSWLVPALLGQPFLRAYLLAEHTGCAEVADMFVNTRTTYSNAPVRFIAWNMPYHIEHHALQAVPFHKLAAFHRHTRPYLKVTEYGYLNVHRKLWAALD